MRARPWHRTASRPSPHRTPPGTVISAPSPVTFYSRVAHRQESGTANMLSPNGITRDPS